MANKNKLVRLKVLDDCFRNRFMRHTLEDLINACAEALYEYEGVDKGISRRSVQEDIKDMRSGKFGYEAPIICEDGCYFYSDKNFSISNSPLTGKDYQAISRSLAVLEQFGELGQLEALRQVEEKLQNVLSAKKEDERRLIQFEKSEYPAAGKWLSKLLGYTRAKQGLTLFYHPFTYDAPAPFDTFPLLLKQYNGRWFLIGYHQQLGFIQNFALDRIVDVSLNPAIEAPENPQQLLEQYNSIIGVSSPKAGVELITFQTTPSLRKYLETKPLHHSQKLTDSKNNVFQLEVGVNFELKARLLSFGSELTVLGPESLKLSIMKTLEESSACYQLLK